MTQSQKPFRYVACFGYVAHLPETVVLLGRTQPHAPEEVHHRGRGAGRLPSPGRRAEPSPRTPVVGRCGGWLAMSRRMATAADHDALVQAEAEALTELSASGARIAELEAEVARIRRDLAWAETARDRPGGAGNGSSHKDADDARTATHTAELAAAEAQATARTLREVIDTLRRAGNDAPAGG